MALPLPAAWLRPSVWPHALRDGKVVEFWNASTDQYANDELIG